MSKSLLLIRHARALNASHHQADIDRALQYEGHVEARNLGKFIFHKNLKLNCIYCSPSLRTRQTWEGMAPYFGEPPLEWILEEKIYEARLQTLTQWISSWDQAWEKVGIIAHNPGISALGSYLDSTSSIALPPAGSLYLDLHIDIWAELYEGCGQLRWYEPPNSIE